jgi:HK97 family phage major capsid protein
MAANETAVAFGDPSKFLRRDVRNSLKLTVAREKYILSNQFGFLAQMRVDGQLVLSSQGSPVDQNAPFKVITQHA